MKLSALLVVVFGVGFCVVACGGDSAPARDASQLPAQPSAGAGSSEEASARPALTAEACEASGGSVVGDIG
ncbi:MAG TPA: hypothetical protein VHM25_00225, partial [Polyangiaceae bacterium]|nr:hypothetical protein [Polyangiaceae bacterium]